MEFRNLKKQYSILKDEIDEAMVRTAASGGYIMGTAVASLEDELAEYVGVKHCVTCANGTDALTLALKAWGIKKGDAVFVPDFTFFASAEVVALEGATPVFVDVDERTFNISASSLQTAVDQVRKEGRLTPRAIIAVDLFGLPADFSALRTVAEKEGLLILEDGAQGFGGSIGDKRSCSFGDIATTSFFPAKPLGCYGDGGAVFTDNDEWAALIQSYRVHGKGSDKYDNVRIGLNSRLDTIQAAILSVKLKAFKQYELSSVNKVASQYDNWLTPLSKIVTTPLIPNHFGSSWAQYTVILSESIDRTLMQTHLKERGIPTMIYYPTPMSQQTAFKHSPTYVDTPTAQRLSKRVLSLPMHPYMEKEQVDEVCKCIIELIDN